MTTHIAAELASTLKKLRLRSPVSKSFRGSLVKKLNAVAKQENPKGDADIGRSLHSLFQTAQQVETPENQNAIKRVWDIAERVKLDNSETTVSNISLGTLET